MKTHQIIIILLCLWIAPQMSFSKDIDQSSAKKIAQNFINQKTTEASELKLVYSRKSAFFVFSSPSSFVIIAADDLAQPILAYSNESSFIPRKENDTTYAANIYGLLDEYEKLIQQIKEEKSEANPIISAQWQNLKQGLDINKSNKTVVEPLMTTSWGQGWPYNADCPATSSGNGHVLAGCVPIAMAQIIHYNNQNESTFQGIGEYSYTWESFPETSANFGATSYDIASMPNNVSDITDPGASEIAKLCYHTAVGCQAQWGDSDTGVGYGLNPIGNHLNEIPPLALVQNYLPLKASGEWVIRSNYSDTEWNTLLQNELINDRVMYYRGGTGPSEGGHAFVCDGIDENEMYHFNFGWSGSYNGYYSINAINPAGYNFYYNPMAMIGLEKNDGSTLISNTTWSGTMNLDNINVPDAMTLNIDPGTVLQFSQNSRLRVWGRILSNGTENNNVKFTAANQNDGWGGIKFHDDFHHRMLDNDTSKFNNTQIEYSQNTGLYIYRHEKVVLDGCKINNNTSSFDGGGLHIFQVQIKITNTEIYNNYAQGEGGGMILSLFEIDNEPRFSYISNCYIHDNVADIAGGGLYYVHSDSLIFKENTVSNNYAPQGAGMKIGGSNPKIINCKFLNNETSPSGFGCIYISMSHPSIIGCLIANNDANGIYGEHTTVKIINSTICYNNHDSGAGLEFGIDSYPRISNCIIHDNVDNNSGNASNINLATNTTSGYFFFNNIEGGLEGISGIGEPYEYLDNMDIDPLFENPTAGAGINYDANLGDFSLQANSECIDAGTLYNTYGLPELDLAGNPRIVDQIDIGAYEAECSAPDQPSPVNGSMNPCKGTVQNYSVENVDDVDYLWTVPNGWNIQSGQGSSNISVLISDNASNGDITVSTSNDCGEGGISNLSVNAQYTVADAGINQTIDYDQSTQLNGTIDGTGNIDILWTANNSSWISTQEDPTTENLTSTTQFTITVSNQYSCSAQDDMVVNVNGGVLSVIPTAIPEEICNGESSQLEANAIGGSGTYTYSWTSSPVGFTSSDASPEVSPTESTAYSVEVSDGNETVNGQVNVNVFPDLGTAEQPVGPEWVDISIEQNSSYETSEVPWATDYEWMISPGNAGTLFPNGQSVLVEWDPSEYIGYCYLSVRAFNDCGEGEVSEELEILLDYLYAISDLNKYQLVLYPNPGKNIYYLKTDAKVEEISIKDIQGKKLLKMIFEDHHSGEYLIDMSSMSNGLYFVELNGKHIQKTLKLMKQ